MMKIEKTQQAVHRIRQENGLDWYSSAWVMLVFSDSPWSSLSPEPSPEVHTTLLPRVRRIRASILAGCRVYRLQAGPKRAFLCIQGVPSAFIQASSATVCALWRHTITDFDRDGFELLPQRASWP